MPFRRVVELLEDQESVTTFNRDMKALEEATAVICVLPCSRSAHLELGYAIANGKRTIILYDDPEEPDLMHRAAGYIISGTRGVLEALERSEETKTGPRDAPTYIGGRENERPPHPPTGRNTT